MGKIREMTSYAHGGAGFYLLLLPIFLEDLEKVKDTKAANNTMPVPNSSASANHNS
jgi:hypothetical protein